MILRVYIHFRFSASFLSRRSVSLLSRFLIRCQQRVPGYRCRLALIFRFWWHCVQERTVMSWKPRLGGRRKTLGSNLGDGSRVIRNIQNWLLSIESRYLIDLIYRYLLLYYLLLESLLICVFVILLNSLTTRLSLEILLSIILPLLNFHMGNFTCCWKRWASRPCRYLGYDLFLRRLTSWSLEWTWLRQLMSAWGFYVPLNCMLILRGWRSSSSRIACENTSSLKNISLLLLMDQLFSNLERLIFIAIACHCKVWLTSIQTNSTHLGITCFLDLAHGTNSILFKITVVSMSKKSFLSYLSYWLIGRLLFDQLGNLWLMLYNIW